VDYGRANGGDAARSPPRTTWRAESLSAAEWDAFRSCWPGSCALPAGSPTIRTVTVGYGWRLLMPDRDISDPAMSDRASALAWAETQVAAARDDPAARLALLVRTYHGPTGRAPRHLPFRRAALSFMRWQAHRGVLNPLDASPPAACGGELSTSDCCVTDAKRSHSSGAYPERRRRRPCGSGWISSRDRRGATGTEPTTQAS
jgi:hypothetical protein